MKRLTGFRRYGVLVASALVLSSVASLQFALPAGADDTSGSASTEECRVDAVAGAADVTQCVHVEVRWDAHCSATGCEIAFECTAASIGAAAATRLGSCELLRNGGSIGQATPNALPGNDASGGGVAIIGQSLGDIDVCWETDGTFVNATRVVNTGCESDT